MNNILVPLDLTKSSEPELNGAIEILRTCHPALHLVEFLPTPAAGFMEKQKSVFEVGFAGQKLLNIEVVKQHRERIQRYAAIFKSEGFVVEASIINDNLKGGIKRYVQNHDIDLIVMEASKGHDLLDMLGGNREEQVIEGNHCPVLSISGQFNPKSMNKLVVAIDLHHNYAPDSMDLIHELTRCFNMTISFVYVKSESEDQLELNRKVHDFREKHCFKDCPVHFIQSDNVEEAILNFAEITNAGMIAMITNAKDGFLRIFTRSISESSDLPVLTLNQ